MVVNNYSRHAFDSVSLNAKAAFGGTLYKSQCLKPMANKS